MLFLHGYNVTSTQTYGELPYCLHKQGFQVEQIEIGRYVSLDDNVGLHQLAIGLQVALKLKFNLKTSEDETIVLPDSEPCAIITHSTGGLIFNAWFVRYYAETQYVKQCPFRYAIHLAPAYFGSRLAHHGRSWANRAKQYATGHNIGTKLLHQLELGAEIQTEIAAKLAASCKSEPLPYIWMTITGCYRYRSFCGFSVLAALNELGTDGAVRIAATNPDLHHWKISSDGLRVRTESISPTISYLQQPMFILPEYAHTEPVVPFHANRGILTHVTKRTRPQLCLRPSKTGSRLLGLINHILATPPEKKEDLTSLAEKFVPPPSKHTQIIVDVRNNAGEPVEDFHLSFYRIHDSNPPSGSKLAKLYKKLTDNGGQLRDTDYFTQRIIHTHRNIKSPHRVVFYINTGRFEPCIVGLMLKASSNTPLYTYPTLDFQLNPEQVESIFRPNSTSYLEFQLHTEPTPALMEFLAYHPATNTATSCTGADYKLPVHWNDRGRCSD